MDKSPLYIDSTLELIEASVLVDDEMDIVDPVNASNILEEYLKDEDEVEDVDS